MTIDNEWTQQIDSLKRQLAEAQTDLRTVQQTFMDYAADNTKLRGELADTHKELDAMRLLAAEPMAVQKVRDELGPLSLWTQSGLEVHVNKCLAEERAKREAVEADLATARQARWVAEQERDVALAGAVAVQEACINAVKQFVPSFSGGSAKRLGPVVDAIRSLNLDPLTAGRALLEPLRKNDARYRLIRQLPGNDALAAQLEAACKEPDSPKAFDAAVDSTIAAGKDSSHE